MNLKAPEMACGSFDLKPRTRWKIRQKGKVEGLTYREGEGSARFAVVMQYMTEAVKQRRVVAKSGCSSCAGNGGVTAEPRKLSLSICNGSV